MSKEMMSAKNTDRELWRERQGDFYADSVHVTEQGGIGINCGGTVHVRTLREWHKLSDEIIRLTELAATKDRVTRRVMEGHQAEIDRLTAEVERLVVRTTNAEHELEGVTYTSKLGRLERRCERLEKALKVTRQSVLGGRVEDTCRIIDEALKANGHDDG